jgi:hypothetical protein
MAQDYTKRQEDWLLRWGTEMNEMLKANDRLVALVQEWDSMGFATGASPPEANITDAVCQGVFPNATALLLNQCQGAIGGVEGINAVMAAVRGYLEPFRR